MTVMEDLLRLAGGPVHLATMLGQVFIRDVDPGRVMVVGIFQKPAGGVQLESIYTAQLTIDKETVEDHKELARGLDIGSVLMQPLWRVNGRKP